MSTFEDKTQAELDAAMAKAGPDDLIACLGDGWFEARESSHVEARESSHVEAWGSSQPHVVARESSQPHVEAKGTVQLSVRGSVAVVAAAAVAICVLGGKPSITGGGFVARVDCSTPQTWCDHYGVATASGYALLYKAVDKDCNSGRGFHYPIGTSPRAPDWDGGKHECGNGLHFSPCPSMAREFFERATRFLACPVSIDEMAVHPDGEYPRKCKAAGLALPCWEVDIDGRPVPGAVVGWPPSAAAREE